VPAAKLRPSSRGSIERATDGRLVALLDAEAVTSLRTGAAAVLAADTLGRSDSGRAVVIGAGVNGKAAARTFLARDRDVALYDIDHGRARAAADELGASVVESLDEALAADLVVTMTPGHAVLIEQGHLAPGQHVSLMGADGPGKTEIAVAELLRARIFCDDWEQASHNGELAHAVEAGALVRDQVTPLGEVLIGAVPGRVEDDDITVFDSTGLAIQDLAIALAALEHTDELNLPTLDL
jgi:ornithine cyclodeaminase/alanine dehydrogenase-like protein (mu-crystallin family)